MLVHENPQGFVLSSGDGKVFLPFAIVIPGSAESDWPNQLRGHDDFALIAIHKEKLSGAQPAQLFDPSATQLPSVKKAVFEKFVFAYNETAGKNYGPNSVVSYLPSAESLSGLQIATSYSFGSAGLRYSHQRVENPQIDEARCKDYAQGVAGWTWNDKKSVCVYQGEVSELQLGKMGKLQRLQHRIFAISPDRRSAVLLSGKDKGTCLHDSGSPVFLDTDGKNPVVLGPLSGGVKTKANDCGGSYAILDMPLARKEVFERTAEMLAKTF